MLLLQLPPLVEKLLFQRRHFPYDCSVVVWWIDHRSRTMILTFIYIILYVNKLIIKKKKIKIKYINYVSK